MNKILYVGYIEFPHGMAQVQRQLTIAKILKRAGYEVTVLCRFGNYSALKNGKAHKSKGEFEGISYEYCSGTPYRPKNFIIRNLIKIKGTFREFIKIIRLGRRKELKCVFITTNYFLNLIFYFMACKLGGVECILDNVEYFSHSKKGKGKLERIGGYLYDHYCFYFIDKIICISNFLVDEARKKMKNNKILKVPAITEFKKFQNRPVEFYPESYLLYCGSIAYYEVIEFVISAFEKSQKTNVLYIISRSNDALCQRIENSPKRAKIRVFSNVSYKKLVSLYNQSTAFVIPLRPNIKDKARFPHKISEFCASANPFISNSFGEVGVYFEDGVSAYLCDEYKIESFAKKMDEVYNNEKNVEMIGRNAYELGKVHFSHVSYVERIKEFIEL